MKSESGKSRIVARRPRPADEVLSRKDLAELQRRLSMMSQTAVEDFYQSAHMVCQLAAFSQREGDPGAGPGMETDEEVAVTPGITVVQKGSMRSWLVRATRRGEGESPALLSPNSRLHGNWQEY